nr:MAG TPA: hypothetical protein [Caudoviricetes sp.]
MLKTVLSGRERFITREYKTGGNGYALPNAKNRIYGLFKAFEGTRDKSRFQSAITLTFVYRGPDAKKINMAEFFAYAKTLLDYFENIKKEGKPGLHVEATEDEVSSLLIRLDWKEVDDAIMYDNVGAY